jgi:hypothetical protein
MAKLTLARFGARSVRMECERVSEQDTSAVYNISGLAYVETYDDVEYVTSAGFYLRQDKASDCKAARDAHDEQDRKVKEAVAEATKKNEADKATVTAS